jgi:putative hydrolase of the HAD superfamily/5'-nucleotidase
VAGSAPPYKALLLDMNGTFMFGQDRFGQDEDYFTAYQACGGGALDATAVRAAIGATFAGMMTDYRDPARLDDFPSVAEALARYAAAPAAEHASLAGAFAAHEQGHVSPEYAACLQRLALTHKFGVVSNIFAPKHGRLAHFDEIGLGELWTTQVFSSDGRSIKPSPALFRRAMAEVGAAPSEILFVGDNLAADILPARALGMATAWVGPHAQPHPAADWTAPSLLALEAELLAQPSPRKTRTITMSSRTSRASGADPGSTGLDGESRSRTTPLRGTPG